MDGRIFQSSQRAAVEADRRLKKTNLDRRAKAARRLSRLKPKASAREFHQTHSVAQQRKTLFGDRLRPPGL